MTTGHATETACSLRIYKDRPSRPVGPRRLPSSRDAAETAAPAAISVAAPAGLPDTIVAKLIALIDAPAEPGESVRSCFERKERALVATLTSLAPPVACELHRRLSQPATDDALAARFGRLATERRARLLEVLANAPRRAARSGTTHAA